MGHGPLLQTYDLSTSALLDSTRLFDVQAIHDIAIAASSGQNDAAVECEIAVIGGDSVALLSVSVTTTWQVQSICVQHAQDWVLRIRHHSLGDGTGFFALLTANNALLRLHSSSGENVKPTVKPLTHGPKSFLYSGDICSAGASKLVLAGGSVFGEVVIWMSYQEDVKSPWIAKLMHRFEAHNGSIFGVRISEPMMVCGTRPARLVASCSDDRQIQIRNIGDFDVQLPGQITPRAGDTGFGTQLKADPRLIIVAWGHQSRIWDVDFAASAEDEDSIHVQLLSRGEDATCQSWWLGLPRDSDRSSPSGELRLDYIDRHHAGKHAWSFAHHATDTSTILISGGADGKLVVRILPSFKKQTNKAFTVLFQDIAAVVDSKVFKDYTTVDSSHTLALTNSGELLLYKPLDRQASTWQLVESPSGSKITKLCSSCSSGIAIVMTEDGLA